MLTEREVGDFVQKQGTAIGGEFEAADAVGLRVRERALGVAEHFAFEHPLSARPPRLTVTMGREAARVDAAWSQRATTSLRGAVLAQDQGVCVGQGPTRSISLRTGCMGRRARDQLKGAARGASARPLLALEPLAFAERGAEGDLGAELVEEAVVVPGLFYVVPRAASHGFDGAFYAAPGGHYEHGERAVERLYAREEVEPFDPAGGVHGVVHVHEHGVEVAGFHGGQDAARGGDGFDVVSLRPEGGGGGCRESRYHLPSATSRRGAGGVTEIKVSGVRGQGPDVHWDDPDCTNWMVAHCRPYLPSICASHTDS